MARWLSDENFNGDIVRGFRLRKPGVDLVRVQDVGLGQADDDAILEWAAIHLRIVLTHDRATMPDRAFARIMSGKKMPGLFVVNDRVAVGETIQELLLVENYANSEEWNNLVVYLPLT
ncbi:DUF5615 family PIN-like protein [Candidatus Sumerlaeota bacterium]|nr:DUF5615 family PIN-like protein [Candidatus Sumerlaeota bacterium]